MKKNYWNNRLKLLFNEEKYNDDNLAYALDLLFSIEDKTLKELDYDSKIKEVVDYTKISKNILEDKYIKYKDRIFDITETTSERALRIWKSKLDEKIKFIEDTLYDATTWEMLDKMQANLVQAFKQHEQIQKEISKEKEQKGQGDSEISLTDKGEI